jgi:hypothetical protein
MTDALKAFEHARFGVFRKDGRFEELPADPNEAMKDPQHMEARWVGGRHDMQLARAVLAITSAPAVQPPIDMVLFCPDCGMQHIDAPEEEEYEDKSGALRMKCDWTNPPHRSHLCGDCGHIWRPADVPTNGVSAVKTKGNADSPIDWPAHSAPAETPPAGAPDAREQALAEAKALADSEGSRAVKYLRVIRKVRAVVDEWPEVDIPGSPLSRIRTIVAFAGSTPTSPEAAETAETASAPKLVEIRERLQNSVNWLMKGQHTGTLTGAGDFMKIIEWIDAEPASEAEAALLKVLSVVQRYLPPDGPTAHDAMSEIIGIVDPWPLGRLQSLVRPASEADKRDMDAIFALVGECEDTWHDWWKNGFIGGQEAWEEARAQLSAALQSSGERK